MNTWGIDKAHAVIQLINTIMMQGIENDERLTLFPFFNSLDVRTKLLSFDLMITIQVDNFSVMSGHKYYM